MNTLHKFKNFSRNLKTVYMRLFTKGGVKFHITEKSVSACMMFHFGSNLTLWWHVRAKSFVFVSLQACALFKSRSSFRGDLFTWKSHTGLKFQFCLFEQSEFHFVQNEKTSHIYKQSYETHCVPKLLKPIGV